MKKSLLMSIVYSLFFCGSAMAYTYIGSWQVDQGPYWGTGPTNVFSGQQAAAFIFGGNATDYTISTIDNNPANINHLAWYTAYGSGDPNIAPILPNGQNLFPAGSQLAEGTVIDLNSNGSYDSGDYSAYLSDWAIGDFYTNYAFRNDAAAVPEPSTMLLLGGGLAGLAFWRKRKQA